MKKISLGSFPLIEISGKDRKIFESYLVKVVSDLVTANQLSNSIYSDRANFITPLSILKFIKEDQKGLVNSTQEPGHDAQKNDRDRKAKTIRNAFRNTKQLYRAIATDPFYKSNLFYPIYIEEQVKSNYGYNDYNYDFLILSNDLIRQQLLDEIIFDDKITMLFLVLKCLLTPDIKITDVGVTSVGQNFRKYFSLFLETCKNENINPFDMFIRIIKAAGKQKRSKVTGALAKISNTIIGSNVKENGLYHSKSFVNLFNTEGEIKSAESLLNFSLKQVNDFLQDTKTIDPNYNPILRQYAQAKTHEYGKVLSIIDALGSFNRSTNVVSELNSTSMLSNVKVDEETTLLINKDVIISELETVYFRRFLEDLKFLEKQAIAEAKKEIKDKFKVDITTSNIETYESVQNSINKANEILSQTALKLRSAKDAALKFANRIGFQTFEDINNPSVLNTLAYTEKRNDLITLSNEYQKLMVQISTDSAKLGKLPRESTIQNEINDKELTLTVNLEIFQAQLTAAYSEIYQFIYSQDFDEEMKLSNGKKINSGDLENNLFKTNKYADINMLKTTLIEIVDGFEKEMEVKLNYELLNNFGIRNFSFKGTISKKINYDNVLNIMIKNVFIPIYTKYSNKAISESNRLKDLKTNNNPLMKKILSKDSLFKAYILTSDTLIESYELLHYIDTIKYEEGIINHPVSKVGNPINKIDFMLKRLGLTDNPVFIYHKNSILLSMPGHLSLTGNNFISQVSLKEFTQFGNINWSADLWNQELMFGGPVNGKEFTKLKDSVSKIEKEIKEANERFKTADAKQKIKIQAQIKAKQEELRKNQEKLDNLKKLQNGNNFTSNTQSDKRPQEQNDYIMQHPNRGGRYNANMDPSGYYQHELNQRNNAMNNSNHLQQQMVPKPEIYQEQPTELGHNEFMNNPYIQNRFNQLGYPNQN